MKLGCGDAGERGGQCAFFVCMRIWNRASEGNEVRRHDYTYSAAKNTSDLRRPAKELLTRTKACALVGCEA